MLDCELSDGGASDPLALNCATEGGNMAELSWFKKLLGLGRHRSAESATPEREPIPPRPPEWQRTIDDLFEEVSAGTRKRIGPIEGEWARDYERSLLKEGIRFPKKGDIYESTSNQCMTYLTAWAAPFTGGGEGEVLKGDRIRVEEDPLGDRPIGCYAVPVEYDTLERRMVPESVRESSNYTGFYFFIKTSSLAQRFTLIKSEGLVNDDV